MRLKTIIEITAMFGLPPNPRERSNAYIVLRVLFFSAVISILLTINSSFAHTSQRNQIITATYCNLRNDSKKGECPSEKTLASDQIILVAGPLIAQKGVEFSDKLNRWDRLIKETTITDRFLTTGYIPGSWSLVTDKITQQRLIDRYRELLYSAKDKLSQAKYNIGNAKMAFSQGKMEKSNTYFIEAKANYKMALNLYDGAERVWSGLEAAGEDLASGLQRSSDVALSSLASIVGPSGPRLVNTFLIARGAIFESYMHGYDIATRKLIIRFSVSIILEKLFNLKYPELNQKPIKGLKDINLSILSKRLREDVGFRTRVLNEIIKALPKQVSKEIINKFAFSMMDEIANYLESEAKMIASQVEEDERTESNELTGSSRQAPRVEPRVTIPLIKTYRLQNGIILREMDLDADGRVERWIFYKDNQLVRTEQDMNSDGIVDEWSYYNGNLIKRVEKDTNNDGRPDIWYFFNAIGEMERSLADTDFDGKVDFTAYYEGNKLVRHERDNNNDGKVDIVAHYDPTGKVVKQEDGVELRISKLPSSNSLNSPDGGRQLDVSRGTDMFSETYIQSKKIPYTKSPDGRIRINRLKAGLSGEASIEIKRLTLPNGIEVGVNSSGDIVAYYDVPLDHPIAKELLLKQ